MKLIVSATLLALMSPLAAYAAVEVNTPVHQESPFSDANLSPFEVCTTQSPARVQKFDLAGSKCVEFYWTQSGYDGTRMDKGAEMCSSVGAYKEGWLGFIFYLPSPGFPTDKEQGIAQLFAGGGSCSSWTGMLVVRNNQLLIRRRHACIDPVEAVIAENIPRNVWVPIIIHFTVSRKNAGVFEVWYGDAATGTYNAPTPTYRATNINFGWGTWKDDDTLDPAFPVVGFKLGMYNYDTVNYTAGESRTLYIDNVSQMNYTDANTWRAVNPRR